MRGILVLIAASVAALLQTAPAFAGPPDIAPAPTPGEARLVTLTNNERALHGARPLAWDPTLCLAARQHSREMADLAYFDHRSPVRGLESPADRWERYNQKTPAEYTIGENLFFGTAADVNWGHQSLMASPEHRANILNRAFSRIGVGVFVSTNNEIWVTEMFVS